MGRGRQQCRDFSLTISPEPDDLIERVDFFGNRVHQFSVQESHDELVVDSNSVVTVEPREALLPELSPSCGEVREGVKSRTGEDSLEALQFCFASPQVPLSDAIDEFAAPFFADDKPFLQAALDLSRHLHETFKFDAKATDVTTPVEAFLELRRGVCQDFAHLMLACLRSQELPGAYVSGYILTQPPPGKPRLIGADASHAWVSVYLPGQGWVQIDPTNDLVCNDQHVVVAWGRDYTDVSLLRGAVTGGGDHEIGIEVTMIPEGEVAVAREKEIPS